MNVAKVYQFWYTFVMNNYNTIYEHAVDNYGIITSKEASTLGIPNIELVKLAHRGRLSRIGHGLYKIKNYNPTAFDKFAEAVALVGNDAIVYGESVLAMHELALVNPIYICIAVKTQIRKKLPDYIKAFHPAECYEKVYYEGIPSQSVFNAILTCTNIIMTSRLKDAISESERRGLLTDAEAKIARSVLI